MTTRSDAVTRLLLFGTPRVMSPSGTFDLPETAPAHLITYLAAQAQWAPRESVAAYLWPDLPDERAQHNLRVALNRAGALLEPWNLRSALVAERRRVRLTVVTDLGEFRAAVARAEWAEACASITAPLFDKVQCAAYPALAEWMTVERESVRRSWRKALIEANQARELSSEALERYLEHHPFDAEMATLLVTRLITTGHAAEAREALSAFRAAATDELAPGEIDAIARQIERAAEGAAPGSAAWDGSDMLGREDALVALSAALTDGGLVTVAGLPGVGKSSLVRAWLRNHSGPPMAVVPVAARTTAAAALERIVSAITGRRSERLSRAEGLRALEAARGVVLLDGVDQAPAEAGMLEMIAALQCMPELRVLITSRRPLGIDGERVLTLAGLSTVSPGDAPSPAAQLFLREARRTRFDLPPGMELAAERVAQASGGLPLALKLSAGWSRWLAPDDIVREFERSVRTERGLDPSLHALVETTWRRLGADQRVAIEALSIWPGNFDMPSAVELAGAPAATIEALSGAGLIEFRDHTERRTLLLHALVRRFGLERLRSAPTTHRRVAARFLSWLDHRLGRRIWVDGEPKIDAEVVAPLIDEVVQAWALALETGDVTAMRWLLAALVSWHEAKGEFQLALNRLAPALDALDESVASEAPMLAALQLARATLAYRAGDFEVAARLGFEAHRLTINTGQAGLGHLALNIVGLSRWMQMRLTEARSALEQALSGAVASDDLRGQRRFAGNLGLIDKALGDYASAETRWRRALDLAISQQEWPSALSMLNNLANLLRHQGRLDECEPMALEALRLCHRHGLDAIRPFALIGLALLQSAKGNRNAAREYLDLLEACDPATLEGAVQAGAAQLRASMALEEDSYDEARRHIVQSLQVCQRHDDAANRAEALEIHGRWLWARGHHDDAEALWRSLLRASSTHASLRDQLAARLQAHGLAANAEGPIVDLAVVVERLLIGRRQ
jgi:DNA-binding SARP family transcriptional activator/tetratricopeptide (TPR) repeat protein